MFVTVEIENLGPYTDKVVFDFRANKKDKTKESSLYTLPDGTTISKIVGLIAGNASGKTSFLDSIITIGNYIDGPIKRRMIDSTMIYDPDEDEPYKEGFISLLNKTLQINAPLITPNKSKKDLIGSVIVELYIDSKDEYEGYYRYGLKFDRDYLRNGMKEESLEFKKKFKDKYKELFRIFNPINSEIGYKIAYEQNILLELQDSISATKKFKDRLMYYRTFYEKYINDSTTLDYSQFSKEEELADYVEKYPSLFKKVVKMVDNSATDIEVSTNKDNEKIINVKYENYKIRYHTLSTATRKTLEFVRKYLISAKKGGILLSDEFDNSLNREVARNLLKIYSSQNNKACQIIFTTTSPEILDDLRRDQIFVLTKRNEKVKLTKFSDYINPETNNPVRRDFSFKKAYKNDVIKNYPLEADSKEFINYIETI